MLRRDFILSATILTTAVAFPLADLLACPALEKDERLRRTFRDLAAQGYRVEYLQLSVDEWRLWKPPCGYSYRDRCNAHVAALAGGRLERRLRCLICEKNDLHPEWMENPVLLRGYFFKVS